MMRFRCPECGDVLDVPDDSAGRTVPCASCHAEIRVPLKTGAGEGSLRRLCSYCRQEIDTGAARCHHCASWQEPYQRRNDPNAGADRLFLWLVVVPLMTAAAVALFMVVFALT